MALARTTIDNAFRTVLARAATDAEIQQYEKSASQAALQATLYDSTAYKAEVLPIAAMYSSILGRQPDASGLGFWVNALRDGKVTMAQAADMFLTSPEASASFGYGDASNEVFVSRNYFNTLGRDPDEGGLKFWVGQLDAHTISRAEVALAIATSPEHMSTVGATRYMAHDTGAVTGVVADGYIVGATVFADANGNGVWNEGEAKTVTDNLGHFSLENAKGKLIALGGQDVSTGLQFAGAYTAGAGFTVLNPLTTLQQQLMAQGASAEQAQASLAAALGLDLKGIDLRSFDPVAVILDRHAGQKQIAALKLQTVEAKVANLLVAISSTLVGAAGQASFTAEQGFKAAVASLAATIAERGNAGVDLADQATLQALLKNSVEASGNAALLQKLNTITAMSKDFAQVLAASAQKVDSAAHSADDPIFAFGHIVQVQAAVQDAVAASLRSGAAQGTLSQIVSSLTGAALDSIVLDMKVGDLDPGDTTDDYVSAWINHPVGGGGGAGGNGPPVSRTFTVAEALAESGSYRADDKVTVSDTAANIAALTANDVARLGKVDQFVATDAVLTLDADLARAIGAARFSADTQVVLFDNGAKLQTLGSDWFARPSTRFDAADDKLTISTWNALRLGPGTLTPDDTVTISGTAYDIGRLIAAQLINPDMDVIEVPKGSAIPLSVANMATLLPKFSVVPKVILRDLAANLDTDFVYDARVQQIVSLDPGIIDWPAHAPTLAAEAAALAKLAPSTFVRLTQSGEMVEGVTIAANALLDKHVLQIHQQGTGSGSQLRLTAGTLGTINKGQVSVVSDAGVHVAATSSKDQISDLRFDSPSLTLEYNAVGQAGTAKGTVAGAALADGDRFALSNVDVVTHNNDGTSRSTAVQVLLSRFNLSAADASDFGGDGTINNGHFTSVRGVLADSTFKVAQDGSDSLILWDADTGAGVKQAAVVLKNVVAGTLDARSAPAGDVLVGARSQFLTVAQALAGNGSEDPRDVVVVADTEENIAALTAAQLAKLTNVDRFHSTGGGLHVGVAQALAIGADRMGLAEVTVSDAPAAFSALTPEQLRTLANGVSSYHAVGGALTLTAGQLGALQGTQLAERDTVVLADTAGNLASLLAGANWATTLFADTIRASDGAAITMTTEQLAMLSDRLDATSHVALYDTGSNLSNSPYLADPRVKAIHSTDGAALRLVDPGLFAKLGADDKVQLVLPKLVEGINISIWQLLDPHIRELSPETGGITISIPMLKALTSAGVLLQQDVHVQATAGQDKVSDDALTTTALWVHYDSPGLAGYIVPHLAGSAIAAGDTIGLVGVDRIEHDPSGRLVGDLISFGPGLGLNENAWSAPSPDFALVPDGGIATYTGKLNGDVFTVDTTGKDTLVLWDDDPTALATAPRAVVLVGAGAVQHWYDDLTHTNIIGVPAHA